MVSAVFGELSSPRSTTQFVVPLAADESDVMMKPDFEYPKASMFDFDERMWTFQEQVFARRRLTFTNGRVEWLCNCAEWHEHQLYHAEADRHSARGAPDSYVPRGRFNQKALGFDDDVFNAFSSLHTHLSSIFPSCLVFGHPEPFFDISLCWYSVPGLRRRRVSQYCTGDPAQNRLPSWSWMGWDGETIFPADLEYKQVPSMDVGFTQAVTKWAATPQQTPKGWERIEFNPPPEWGADGDSLELRAKPSSMPRELPRYAYVHVTQYGHLGDYQWYPMPVRESDSTSDGGDESGAHSNFQYLQSVTIRAYLYRGPNKNVFPGDYIHLLYDRNGNTVGGLRGIHYKGESRTLEHGARLELLAVAKGWFAMFSHYIREEDESTGSNLPEDDAFLTEEEEEEEERTSQEAAEHDREANGGIPWMERGEEDKKTKQDCYHVLWIEWEQGVAYRKGCGFVLEDKWEELAELDKVVVTLC
ncbi:uncharacterized protein PG986_010702 [Apiospora aurea]|uniref:Heterokaryon incompatibility protein n=1 Tax=Apiospora aurea TaxID=335848 RepID=A0ABR1Q306_9PEZI